MDISLLTQYFSIIVVGICLCIGYVIKNSLDFIPNKYIPLVMLVLGTITNLLININNINAEIILVGMFSGLSSTGLHQVFTQLINKGEK